MVVVAVAGWLILSCTAGKEPIASGMAETKHSDKMLFNVSIKPSQMTKASKYAKDSLRYQLCSKDINKLKFVLKILEEQDMTKIYMTHVTKALSTIMEPMKNYAR